MQCAFSPLGKIANAGLVHIARNTNFWALEKIFIIVFGISSLGICSNTSVDYTPSKGPSGSISYSGTAGSYSAGITPNSSWCFHSVYCSPLPQP